MRSYGCHFDILKMAMESSDSGNLITLRKLSAPRSNAAATLLGLKVSC